MDKEIIIIGHGEIARSMAQFPNVKGYVHVENLSDILHPLTGELMEKVNPEKHVGVIGIGKPQYKERRVDQWKKMGCGLTTLIHPSAYVDPRVEIGEGSSIWPFTYIDGDSKIGKCTIIGAQSNIHYANVGDYCHITMQVNILPHATIKDKSFVGTRATILENVVVGEGAAISTNSVVSKDVEDRNLFFNKMTRKGVQRRIKKGIYYPLTNREKRMS